MVDRALRTWRLRRVTAAGDDGAVLLEFEGRHGETTSVVAKSEIVTGVEAWNTEPPLSLREDYGDTRTLFAAAKAFLVARQGRNEPVGD
jgi:hypothetical protein